MRDAPARAYPKDKVAVRRFGGGWHVSCGACSDFVCSNCLGWGKPMTHAEAFAFAQRHIREKHS